MKLAALLIAFLPVQALRGWALSVMWGWFVVPFGLPSLQIPTAVGVSLIASLLGGNDYDPESYASKHTAGAIASAVLQPLLAVAVGFIWMSVK